MVLATQKNYFLLSYFLRLFLGCRIICQLAPDKIMHWVEVETQLEAVMCFPQNIMSALLSLLINSKEAERRKHAKVHSRAGIIFSIFPFTIGFFDPENNVLFSGSKTGVIPKICSELGTKADLQLSKKRFTAY